MSQVTTQDLWNDGRAVSITAVKSTPTSLTLNWNLPTNPVAYAGAVVLVSEQPLTGGDFPVDGTRYVASSNLLAPADLIGSAVVVAAFYGFFGDPINQTTVTVTNLNPTKLYYASIHVCSNILQYYTIGSQSYPLEANDRVAKSSSYAGAIPTASSPPQNPTNGQVYYDNTSSYVFVWNNTQQAWIRANKSTVPIGDSLPISTAQLYYNTGTPKFEYFDGTQLQVVNSTNLRVKMGGAYAPFNSIMQDSTLPTNPTVGDWIYQTLPPQMSAPATFCLKVYSLGQWYNPSPDMVQVLVNGVWTPIADSSYAASFGEFDPIIPAVGDFFYLTSSKDLMVWAGSGWVKADTADPGVPTTDRVGAGTDGTNDARDRLKQQLQVRLGYPNICVELDRLNLDLSIDNALAQFRQRADNAYAHRHISFTLYGGQDGGQSTYYLNDPRDKTDKIVSVIKIHRINQLGVSSLSAETGLYAQAFFNQLYQGSSVDVISLHLMSEMSKLYEKIFAGQLVFTWNEASRELIILRRLQQARERVLLEVSMEREEQELMTDRWCKMWIQDWAFAECMAQLSQIRGKYGTLPSAQGGLTLNGTELAAEAAALKIELLRQINDYEVGNGGVDSGSAMIFRG